jgi:hypothetical protein
VARLLYEYWILNDPAGDQIMTSVISEKHTQDTKNFGATGTFTAGTGKFTGIEGGITFLCHNNAEFRTAAAGTYVFYADLKASYKLPWPVLAANTCVRQIVSVGAPRAVIAS